jgi:hypothetical protein
MDTNKIPPPTKFLVKCFGGFDSDNISSYSTTYAAEIFAKRRGIHGIFEVYFPGGLMEYILIDKDTKLGRKIDAIPHFYKKA